MSEKITYKGKVVEVVEFDSPDGERVYEKARRAPGVRLILPVGEDSIILTKEYRQEIDGYDYRLPGGKVFDSLEEYNSYLGSGFDVADAVLEKAKEEGEQEAGIIPTEIMPFHVSVLGATMEWDLYYLVVESYTESNQKLEPGEDIETIIFSKEEARKICLDGSISEERSALTLLRYLS